MDCILNAQTSRYLPKSLESKTENFETEHFQYDHSTNSLNCKLLTKNPYASYFKQIYPSIINEHELNNDIKSIYYRGLHLSDVEIKYYIEKQNQYYYTNSFLSFTIDRLLIYPGNSILILNMENSSKKAKKNLANIWKWSACKEEKEVLLAVGSKLKILSVHFFGYKWQIEVELTEDDDDDE